MILPIATPDEWWNLWTALIGAVVGSVVGGIISYVLARQASNEERARADAAILEQKKAIALRVSAKISKIASSLGALHTQTEQQIAQAERAGLKTARLSAKMLPMIGNETRIYFDPDELSLFLSMNDNELLSQLMVLDERHNSLISAFEAYATKRAELTATFPAMMNGQIGTTEMDERTWRMVEPRMVELDMLAEQIRQRAKEDLEEVTAILPAFGPKIRAFFKDSTFPIMAVDMSPYADKKGARK